MPQTGYTPIQLYKSATAAAAPVAGNLQDGELAINTNDGKLFYKDSGGVVQTMASKAAAAGTFSSVTITGGTINNTAIGGTTAAAGSFTNLSYTGTLTGGTGVVNIGSNQFYKDASGRIGLGVVPSGWSGAIPLAIDFAGGGLVAAQTNGTSYLGANTYYNGTNWTAKATGTGGLYQTASDGVHTWFSMASVSGGATQSLTQTLRLDASGNLTATANVTAYSDERLKKDWAGLPADFLERVAQAKVGTYTRIDSGERQAGSSAQDWQKILPEVVLEGSDDDKTLSVAYGNAALVTCVKLAQRVLVQDELIAALERRLAALEK